MVWCPGNEVMIHFLGVFQFMVFRPVNSTFYGAVMFVYSFSNVANIEYTPCNPQFVLIHLDCENLIYLVGL